MKEWPRPGIGTTVPELTPQPAVGGDPGAVALSFTTAAAAAAAAAAEVATVVESGPPAQELLSNAVVAPVDATSPWHEIWSLP